MAATNEFMHHLSMAACEWFLMLLMYLDAALGFIVTKFAHQCELQSPCLFCFRFDHVFGVSPDYYLSHFCGNHRAEVSCLVSCDLHHKLADVRNMCDDCFMSTMKQNQRDVKPLLNKNLVRVPSSTGSCSCCKSQWKPKPKRKIRLGLPKVTRHPPLPLVTGSGRYLRRNYFKKARDRISGTTTPCHVDDDIHMDALSDSGCADLKFSSCSGSESGDSFYEIECENEGYEDYSCVAIRQAQRSVSACNRDPSLKGTHNESLTSLSPQSLISNGPIGHDVKVNRPLDERSETSPCNQDLHSINDDEHEGYESPSTHSVGENKGESEQLRLLHKELEEERNAAAIAADEAMAMITRLQEEKSALHMEALQYLRMMDEQAEYDMEALDKANDLVNEKDKEIQDLEAELEFFRSRYDDEFNNKENHMGNGKIDSMNTLESRAVLDLEDEKKYILQSLSEVERKFDKPLQQNENDMGTLENEISDLNEWLEAVELDRDFLEHACNTVQSQVGLEFIQEIAKHLQDLRRVRFDRRGQTVD